MHFLFIKLRSKQLFQATQGIGLFRLILIFIALFATPFILFKLTVVSESAIATSSLALLIIGAIHFRRPDITFLQINLKNFKSIIAVEYLIFTSPLILGLIVHKQWIALAPYIITLLIISQITLQTKSIFTLNTPIQALIPSTCFEWKSGVRQTIYIIVPLWILGILTPFALFSAPIIIILLAIIAASFYEKSEPLQMILAMQMSSKRLIQLKIKQGLLLYSALAVPLILLFTVFHAQYWYIPVILYIVLSTNIIYIILIKYAHYQAQSPTKTMNAWSVLSALMVIPLLMPVLLPVVWILSIRFYKKSITNLNPYLNDFN